MIVTSAAYLAQRWSQPELANLQMVLSPMILLGSLGALLGCLCGARWTFLLMGVAVGAAPILLALVFVLMSQ